MKIVEMVRALFRPFVEVEVVKRKYTRRQETTKRRKKNRMSAYFRRKAADRIRARWAAKKLLGIGGMNVPSASQIQQAILAQQASQNGQEASHQGPENGVNP